MFPHHNSDNEKVSLSLAFMLVGVAAFIYLLYRIFPGLRLIVTANTAENEFKRAFNLKSKLDTPNIFEQRPRLFLQIPETSSIVVTKQSSKKYTLQFQDFMPSSLSNEKMVVRITRSRFIGIYKKHYRPLARHFHPDVPKQGRLQILHNMSKEEDTISHCMCKGHGFDYISNLANTVAKEIWDTYQDECREQVRTQNEKMRTEEKEDAESKNITGSQAVLLSSASSSAVVDTPLQNQEQKYDPMKDPQIRRELNGATKLNPRKLFNNDRNRITLADKLKQNKISYRDFINFLLNNKYDVSRVPIPHEFTQQAMDNLVNGNAADINILFKSGLSPNTLFIPKAVKSGEKRSLLFYAIKNNSPEGVRILLEEGANSYYIPDSDEMEISLTAYCLTHNIPAIKEIIFKRQNALAEEENLKSSIYEEHNYKGDGKGAKLRELFNHPLFAPMICLDIGSLKIAIQNRSSLFLENATIFNSIITFRLPKKIFMMLVPHPEFKRILQDNQNQSEHAASSGLFLSAKFDAYWLVSLYLRYGVPVDITVLSVGLTPLILAAEYRAHRTMEVLMSNGADPNAQSLPFKLPNALIQPPGIDSEAKHILSTKPLMQDQELARQQMQTLLGEIILTVTPRKTFLIQLSDELMNCHLRKFSPDEERRSVSEEKLGQSDNTATYRMSFRETTASNFTSYVSADEVDIKLSPKQFIKQFIQILPEIDPALEFQVVVHPDKNQLEIPAGGYEYNTFPMEKLFNFLAQTIWKTSINDKGKEICDRLGNDLSMFGQFTFDIDRENNLQLHFPVGSPIKCSVNDQVITITNEEFYSFLNTCFHAQIAKVTNTPSRADSSENHIVLTLPLVNDPQFSLEEIVESMKAKLLEHHQVEQTKNRKPEVLKVPKFTKQQRVDKKRQEEDELRAQKTAEEAEKKQQETARKAQYELTEEEGQMYGLVATMEDDAFEERTRKIRQAEYKKTKAESEAKKQTDTDNQKSAIAIGSEANQPQKTISRMNRLNEVFALATKIGVAIALHHTSPSNEPESKLDITPEKQFKAALSLQCYLQKLVCQLIEIQKGLGLDVTKLKKLFRFRTSAGHMLNHLDKTTIFDGIKEIVKVLMDQYTPDKLKQTGFVVREFSAIATLFDFNKAGMDPNSYNPIFDLAKTSLYRAAETYYTDLQNDNFFTDIKSEPTAKPISKPIQEGLLSSSERESLLKETPNFLANVEESWIPLINRLWLRTDDAPRQPKTVFYSAPLPTAPRQSYELNDDLIDIPAATTLLSIIGELYPRLRRDQVNGMTDASKELKEFLLRCKIIRNALCHWGGDSAQHGIENNGIIYKTIYKKDEDTQEISCWIQFGRFRREASSFVGQPQETKFDDFVVKTCELAKKINSNKLAANARLDTSYQRLVSPSVSADEMTSTETLVSEDGASFSSASSVISTPTSMMDTRSSSAVMTPFVTLVNNNQRPSLPADAPPFVPADNSGPTATNSPSVTSTTEQLKM